MNELHKAIRREMRNANFTVTKRAKSRDEEIAVREGYLTEQSADGTIWIYFVPRYLTYDGRRLRPLSLSENLEARETAVRNVIHLLSEKGFSVKFAPGECAKVVA